MRTGPPFERLYAVEPAGVAQISPSHGWSPRSSPAIAQPSSTIRPGLRAGDDDVVDGGVRLAVERRPRACGSSTTRNSPANARARPASSSARVDRGEEADPAEVDAEHRHARAEEARASARSIVPSPPSTTARSGSCVLRGRRARARGLLLGEQQLDARVARDRLAAGRPRADVRARPCVTTAAAHCSTDGGIDPASSSGRAARRVDEVEEELPVSLRRRAGPRLRRRPRGRPSRPHALGDLVDDPALHLRVADDAALRRRPPGPASNWGFTSTSARQPGAAQPSAGGSAMRRPR